MIHLNFLYIAVSWVLLRWHDLFTLIGFSDSSGWGWTLSIIFLVITARLLLFRVFVRQVHSMRNMQRMQPKIKKLREKYKDDKPELNRQMMALQQEEGFNPISGCLPMVLQIPVFIGLFHVLRHLSNSVRFCSGGVPGSHVSAKASNLLSLYTFDKSETCSAASAKILGTPLAASFRDSSAKIHNVLGGDATQARILLVVLLLISAGATMGTQLLSRANQTVAPEGQAAMMQKVMLYIIPGGVLVSGLLFNFPLGVLLYWFTSNIWTLGQQAYIIRFHPPEDEKVAPVGELGKTLAPKAGARPNRDRRPPNRPAASGDANGTVDMSKPNADSGNGAGTRAANGGKGVKNGKAGSAQGSSSPGSGNGAKAANGRSAESKNGSSAGSAAGRSRAATGAGTTSAAQGRSGQKPAGAAAARPAGKRPTKSKKRR